MYSIYPKQTFSTLHGKFADEQAGTVGCSYLFASFLRFARMFTRMRKRGSLSGKHSILRDHPASTRSFRWDSIRRVINTGFMIDARDKPDSF